jgi:hypothetical protein
LVLYKRADIVSDTLMGTMTITSLAERGNVRALTAADAALFEIPPGFTPAASPTASPTTIPAAALPTSAATPY